MSRRVFGFETTLAGRGYRRLVKRLKVTGFRVVLVYLALPSVDIAKLCVAEQVSHGDRDIPVPEIRRRFLHSVERFLSVCALRVNEKACFSGTNEAARNDRQGALSCIYPTGRRGADFPTPWLPLRQC